MNEGNRAILLTAPGSAAIAVVRVRGPLVAAFLESRFSPKRPTPLRCVHGELRDAEGRVLDDPVVVLHEDEITADVNLHGGPWVIASMLELLTRNGFEIVEADMELLERPMIFDREVQAALPRARTEEAVRILLAQPAAWREFVAEKPPDEAVRRVLDDRCLSHLLDPPRVAIVGPPNVGKSTLANQLFGQQRSITADLPGTTRDWVGEVANVDGLPVVLVDTPGLRETSDHIESAAIVRAREVIAGADLVLSVSDPLTPPSVAPSHTNEIRVLNKGDLLGTTTTVDSTMCVTVATTGQGLDALRHRIRRFFGCADLSPDRPRCWTERQRAALQRDPRDVLVGHE